jgi:two-component system, LytTR family, response regulator
MKPAITCIIVDDEMYAIKSMERHIAQTPFLSLKKSFSNPAEALQYLRTERVDLVFLDIQMPEMTGLEFLGLLPEQRAPKVIMTSGYSEYALDGYEHGVADYLLKPVTYARFFKAVQRLHELPETDSREQPGNPGNAVADHLFVKLENKGKQRRIGFEEIDHIEGQKNYVYFYCGKEKIVTHMSLRDLEKVLPPAQFIRIHNSFIVHIGKVQTIEGNVLMMRSGAAIPIGITYKSAFFERITIK